jgi:putative restriction endonuclease
MRQAIGQYRAGKDIAGSEEIGCILLFHPVFFSESQWVEQPDSWKDNIVSGAGIDIDDGEGARIYEACKQRMLWLHENTDVPTDSAFVQSAKFGTPYEVKPRLGQGAFRLAVTEAYGRACAVSGEHSLPVLDAAHIQPFGGEGDHRVQNGLLLRADIHRLFDKGYVTVTPDLEFVVSKRLREEFSNGKIYYALHGKQVSVPQKLAERPEKSALIWHNENLFERFG